MLATVIAAIDRYRAVVVPPAAGGANVTTIAVGVGIANGQVRRKRTATWVAGNVNRHAALMGYTPLLPSFYLFQSAATSAAMQSLPAQPLLCLPIRSTANPC